MVAINMVKIKMVAINMVKIKQASKNLRQKNASRDKRTHKLEEVKNDDR